MRERRQTKQSTATENTMGFGQDTRSQAPGSEDPGHSWRRRARSCRPRSRALARQTAGPHLQAKLPVMTLASRLARRCQNLWMAPPLGASERGRAVAALRKAFTDLMWSFRERRRTFDADSSDKQRDRIRADTGSCSDGSIGRTGRCVTCSSSSSAGATLRPAPRGLRRRRERRSGGLSVHAVVGRADVRRGLRQVDVRRRRPRRKPAPAPGGCPRRFRELGRHGALPRAARTPEPRPPQVLRRGRTRSHAS